MSDSYRLIDYSLRPAKFAERKMLCEMFGRLRVFGSLEHYRYVGFGSIWFADCVLFHRSLGIQELISIERQLAHESRFVFNNPYGAIDLRMGTAADVLPNLDWTHRSIVWLDYDDPLSPSILDDIRTVATRARSGTALVISVQAQGLWDERNRDEPAVPISTRTQFLSLFGTERTPTVLPNSDLRGWGLSLTSRRVIRQEIENRLREANIARSPGQRMQFRQITAFEYADGAKMTTVGGIFVDSGHEAIFDGAGFRSLLFFRDGDGALRAGANINTYR